mmetsp:Transcript_17439/g.23513  ORF Transcript_17439/g.23513 Transcript_17439/m.23513 type:complete len:114 (+) Transcript_17439:36-377(+)
MASNSLISNSSEPLLNERQTEPNRCQRVQSLCKLFLRTTLFSLTLILEGWFFYRFCIDFCKDQLEEYNMERRTVVMQKGVVCAIQLMSMLSLLSIFFSNPGFVSDYFTSEELT